MVWAKGFPQRYKVFANATISYSYNARSFTLASHNCFVVMIVCVCHRVSDREIARHAHAGMSFDEIQFELGVATQCGCCESYARDIVAQCCATARCAAIHNEASEVQTVEPAVLSSSTSESKAWHSSHQPLAV